MIDWLDEQHPRFPSVHQALDEPDGLLAAGGNLAPDTLLEAYASGIFPWYGEEDPILWWSPAERCVLELGEFHVSRSLKRAIKSFDGEIVFDRHFDTVIELCGSTRPEGTWITPEMQHAYCQLNKLGFAHSVALVQDNRVVAGVYGVAMHPYFFGESMFTTIDNGSKIALYYLVTRLIDKGYRLIDCQQTSSHVLSLGATVVNRDTFVMSLKSATYKVDFGSWDVSHAD